MSAALLLPSDRPTEPMNDDEDDGAPTEFWRRPSDEDVRPTAHWPSAIARTPARRGDEATVGASVAPVAIDAAPRPRTARLAAAPSSGTRTFALGAAIIGVAACLGLTVGHLARKADLEARARVSGDHAATPAAAVRTEPASNVRPAAAVDVDSLPSAPSEEKAVPPRASAVEPTAGAELDRAAATAAIARGAAAAAGCDGAEGALVQVTFAPSGRVATIHDDGLSGRSRACVAAAFRGAAVPPFRGPAVTIAGAIAR